MFEYLPVPCEKECEEESDTPEKTKTGSAAEKPILLRIALFRIILLLSAAALLYAVKVLDAPYFERITREFDYVVRSDTAADKGILSAAEYIAKLLISPPGEEQ